jgi:hypothetical protein
LDRVHAPRGVSIGPNSKLATNLEF